MKKARGRAEVPNSRDGQEAVDYLAGTSTYGDRTKYPLPDPVLGDLKLPVRSGFDMLAWLREREQFQNLPVKFLGQ